ncbi:glycoside hydrolase domain-containing protein [[Ruminococcus] lactaris]|uniref:glycoside hydrolase domain-containing protein n=1 Tax=[Ruminococcus] lactaris TaxID=46228 RepID=UPI00241C811A|nr:glycoside hydrolase domain-containing protein [[Ruminococcus] lactaris]
MDQRVKDAQVWLNQTYRNCSGYTEVPEDGHTGVLVMEGLVTALQIELGIEQPTGYFGDTTASVYEKHILKKGDSDSDMNLIRIMQHGLYCKGYNPTAVTGYFGDNTAAAVKKVQMDAGFDESSITDSVSAKVLKQILSSDALILVENGDPIVRTIQQTLNKEYGDLFDLIPCDGKYNAATNKALIYAFQIAGGMSKTIANGTFGPATQDIAKNNILSVGSSKVELIKIAKWALYINGVRRNKSNIFNCTDNDNFTGIFDINMENVVKSFQTFTGMLEIDGKIGINVWMSLMVSTGYPKRNVLACDTSTQITEPKAYRIYVNDFRIVGRYLTGSTASSPKNLTRDELSILFDQGLSVFAIYQDEKQYYIDHPDEETTVNYYNYDQGYNDAQKAIQAAENLGIAYGEPIFFAVDYDFNDSQTTSMIIPHFRGISDYIRKHGNKYIVGCYGPRNICKRVYENGYTTWSFVSDMSTGFSGNKGFLLPDNWVFDQIREYTQGSTDGSFALDCVASSGKYNGFTSIYPSDYEQEKPSSTDIAQRFSNNVLQLLGLDIDTIIWEQIYTFELINATIQFQTSYGKEVSLGKGTRRSQFTVKNGTIEDATYSDVLQATDEVSYNTSAGINSEGMIDFQNKVQYVIDNGYIEVGFNISSDGTASISYLIHKDASLEEGISDFTEIGIEITFKEKLTEAQINEYNTQKATLSEKKGESYARKFFDFSFSLPSFNTQGIAPATQVGTTTVILGFVILVFTVIAFA